MQRWLFRRELEQLAPARVYYLDECGVDHRLYREYGRALRGERIYETVAGGAGNGPVSLPPAKTASWSPR